MLNIYICEDNKEQRNIITNYINNVILIEDSDLELALSTADPHEVLSAIDNNKNVGLYFLDIDLNSDINGLTLAQQIRQKDPRGFIVFVTTHSEMCYMTFTYKVEAMDFIPKDDKENLHSRIHQCINNAYSRYSSSSNFSNKVFAVKIGDKEYCVPHEEILYIETSPNPHKIILHTANSTLEFKGKIKDVQTVLGSKFVICHRSTIVNKNHVKEIDLKNRTVTLSNGEICIVSAKYIHDLS
jgi:two-component system response regulator AgrA